ncbi:hypothetical protein K461DRAFT_314839 [Myriangium duriaei CBS 260.36]|uniref:Arylsulfotransferase N-terminal domain-containing protein n=1 Tax=Myriangium duriaei CBS 260.36 TaxID=1168546 RepID=A0A9P4MDB2_9PEZI|nr:hypothetical protein K461DRAFT_314839 [Myriangium duriaei CBS 260.36]
MRLAAVVNGGHLASLAAASTPVPKLWSRNSVSLTTNASTVWPWQTYITSDVKPPYLEVNATGEDLVPGLVFYTPTAGVDEDAFISRLGPLISSDNGDLVWAGPVSGDASNLRVQTLFDQPVISFWEGTGAAASGLLAGHGYGQVQVYNTSYDLIATICPKLNLTKPPKQDSDCDADVHESYITEAGTVLVTAYNVTNADLTSVGGPQQGYVFDTLIVEIDVRTSEVLFLWSPLEHVPLSASKYPVAGAGRNTSNPYDFFHANAIYPWEGGYLINSRHTWTTYFVGRDGKIIWEINGLNGGDFGSIPQGGHFSWQHNAEIRRISPSEVRISWFANNDVQTGQTNITTGVELALTLPPNTTSPPRLISNVSDLIHPVYSFAEGSHQLLPNGDRFLGYGYQPYIKYFGAEDSTGGDLRWSARYAYPDGASSYRAFKQEWHAVPSTVPTLVVKRLNVSSTANDGFSSSYLSSRLRGYVSWNGATDVGHYNVYGGSNSSSLALIGIVSKQGFETEFYIPDSGYTAFQVGALFNGTAQNSASQDERRSQAVSIA